MRSRIQLPLPWLSLDCCFVPTAFPGSLVIFSVIARIIQVELASYSPPDLQARLRVTQPTASLRYGSISCIFPCRWTPPGYHFPPYDEYGSFTAALGRSQSFAGQGRVRVSVVSFRVMATVDCDANVLACRPACWKGWSGSIHLCCVTYRKMLVTILYSYVVCTRHGGHH